VFLFLFGHPHHSTRLDGQASLRLSRVDASGATGRSVRTDKEDLAEVARQMSRLEIKLPKAHPARYRVSFTLTRRGRALRRFVIYVVVPDPRFDPRLTLNGAAFAPGQPVRGRVENFGSIALGYGFEYGLQRLETGTWVNVATAQDFVPDVLEVLAGGGSGSCQTFEARGGFNPGHYRATIPVNSEPFQAGRRPLRLRTDVMAEFDVNP
jgi:hypothetical protein